MKNMSILSCFIFCNLSLLSQRMIEVSYHQDQQGSYEFFCNNKAYCSYILEVKFTSLENAKSDHLLPYIGAVNPGRTNLFKLSKENTNNLISFKYKISYTKGCINPRVNPDFTYLLPIAPGKQAQAYEMENMDKQNPGDPRPKDWYVIRLKMNPGDTIFAARRGIVTEVEDQSNLNDSGLPSAGSENYIEIVHRDCSFGHYGILKRNSALIKLGQAVEAGQPIGLVGGDRYGRGAEARFSVYYNIEQKEAQKEDGTNEKVTWAYIPLQFWTEKNGKGKLKNGATYISEHPQSLITQEAKKIEKRKLKTKGKSA